MRKPYVILSAAMSLDGKIGRHDKRIVFSNEEDKKRVHELRSKVDAIMVGINTILVDNPKLTAHYSESKKNPIRIIVDSKARTPENANVLNNDAKTIIAVSQNAPELGVKKLEKKGVEIIKTGRDKVNLIYLMEKLYRKGIKSILLEGGGTLIHSMFSLSLIDEIYLTIAPKILGMGVELINGDLEKEIKLNLEGIRQINELIVLHYTIEKK